MRRMAGDRGIDAALDTRTATGARSEETADRAKRRKLQRAKTRTRRYLDLLRKGAG